MCATVLTRKITMTLPFVRATRYRDSTFNPVENEGGRQRSLNRKWVVVTDQHGKRTLRMCWAVAPFVEPVLDWVFDPTPGPQPQAGTS